jgi:hypothetical protein
MAIDTRLLGQIKQALAKNLVKQAAPPTFPAERPNPAAAPSKPAPAPTSVDKAISASRAAAPTGPTSADLAIQATRRQNALGRGQLATGTAPGASMAAPDYASARQLEDLTRSENVRAKMQNAGKYVADAASSAVGFGRSALDNAAAIKKHMDHASSSPVGYLASLGQNSGSDFLDRVGTSLVDPQAGQSPVGVAAGGRSIMPNEYANYQANRASASQMAATAPNPGNAPATAAAPVSAPSKLNTQMAQAPAQAAQAANFNYPPVPASGNYNDHYDRLNIDDDQPTYQRLQRLPRPGDNPSWYRPRFPGQTLRGMTMTGVDSLTPNRPYAPTMSGMQPSPPADYLSYMKQEIERNKPRS